MALAVDGRVSGLTNVVADLVLAWTLLEHVCRYAEANGIRTIESIESRDNHAAIEFDLANV